MRWLFALLLLFVWGCAQEDPVEKADDFGTYMGNVHPDSSYTVYHSYYNSGFASIGEVNVTDVYEVIDQTPPLPAQGLTPMSMDQAKDLLWEYAFNESMHIDADTVCFLEEKTYMHVGIACFRDDKLVLTHIRHIKGNHQTIDEIWRLNDFEIPKQGSCSTRFTLCPYLVAAAQYDSNICNKLTYFKEDCFSAGDLKDKNLAVLDSDSVDKMFDS